MWNSNTPSEFNSCINGAQPAGGVAPLQYDQARQVNLEKRWVHAEMDRRSQVWTVWTTLSQWAYDTSSQHCQTALHWVKERMGRSVPETSRP